MKKFFLYIWYVISSKSFWVSLVLIAVILVAGSYILVSSLNSYTHKDESITVPDLKGMTLKEVEDFLDGKLLRIKVIDSVYNTHAKPTEVISQIPVAGKYVKENRAIYLTIQSVNPDMAELPDIEQISLRNAESKLKNAGFQLGERIYKPYLYINTVLYVMKDDERVKPGELFPKGATFDIVVGNGLGETVIEVPQLSGHTVKEAQFILFGGYNLNIGSIYYDNTIETKMDSVEALIYDQFPPKGTERRIGEFVNVWLTNKENYKLLADTTDFSNPDMDISIDTVERDIKMK
jgi:eukaryotic-like serine/threonine-protein kinase